MREVDQPLSLPSRAAVRPLLPSRILVLALLALMWLSGCTGSDDPSPQSVVTLEGFAINGPLVGAMVVIYDQDGNELARTETDANGYYRLEGLPEQVEYRVVASGGLLNGLPYTGTLTSRCSEPPCSVTPLTTAMDAWASRQGITIEQAQAQILGFLGLSSDPFLSGLNGAEPPLGIDLDAVREALSAQGIDAWVETLLGAVASGASIGDMEPGLFGPSPEPTPQPEPSPTPSPSPAPAPAPVTPPPPSYTVSTSAGEGGSISPTSHTVTHGNTTTFTVTPDEGYEIVDASGCNGELDGQTFTTGAITANCTVQASFTLLTLDSPANVEAAGDDGRVTVIWDSVPGATGYSLYWSLTPEIDPGVPASYNTVNWQTGVSSPHTVTDLTNGDKFYFVVTATAGSVESAASEEVSATPFEFVPVGGLNDTGIDWCANDDTNHLGCPAPDYPPEQDGESGRDAAARVGTLDKIGGGDAGFDFTKIGSSGNALPAGASEWSCVRDNVTGLMWEVKVDDATSLHHKDHTYSWYNTDSNTNGGVEGEPNGGVCVGSDCDTEAFVQAVNSAELCGWDDWRLPSPTELLSIVHNGRAAAPAIDEVWFPNTSSERFWTAFISIRALRFFSTAAAYTVHFETGGISRGDVGGQAADAERVRLVRGALQAASPSVE